MPRQTSGRDNGERERGRSREGDAQSAQSGRV
jgi:hypothetical protein